MKIFEVGLGSEKILVCQYAPSIQIQSALDPISKEYFLKIFKSKKPNIDEFAHSYVPADTSGQSMGARMVVYSDAKIVLGKAPNHAYLMYQPGSVGSRVEGYYSTKKKSIVFSGEENSQYSQAFDNRSWKTIFSRLSISGLVDDNWKIRGCPPVCGEREFVNVGEIISGYWDSGVEGKEKTLKRKDAESLVQNFRIKKAIQNKDLNHMAYLYRYADGQVHSGRIKTFLEWLGGGFLYHGADPDNRESIRAQGLKASNPAEDDSDLHDEGEERRGVWVFEDIEDAMEWGQDVWEVDARGLEMGDLVGEEHSFVKSDIPPNRIRLVVAAGERLAS